jgi:hypothetical protein
VYETPYPQKLGRHRKSEERNTNVIPRKIPARPSRDKKRAGQKLKAIFPVDFHNLGMTCVVPDTKGLFHAPLPRALSRNPLSLRPRALSGKRGENASIRKAVADQGGAGGGACHQGRDRPGDGVIFNRDAAVLAWSAGWADLP